MQGTIDLKKLREDMKQLAVSIRIKKIMNKQPQNRPLGWESLVDPFPTDMVKFTNRQSHLSFKAHVLCTLRAHHRGKLHNPTVHPDLATQEAYLLADVPHMWVAYKATAEMVAAFNKRWKQQPPEAPQPPVETTEPEPETGLFKSGWHSLLDSCKKRFLAQP